MSQCETLTQQMDSLFTRALASDRDLVRGGSANVNAFMHRGSQVYGSAFKNAFARLSDQDASLIHSVARPQGREWVIETLGGGFQDARRTVESIIGKIGGSKPEPFYGELFQKGRVVGFKDGDRGWRFDIDRKSGEVHLNFWGKDSRGNELLGRVNIPNLNEDGLITWIEKIDSIYQ